MALPDANALAANLAGGASGDRVPDFGDVWPTLYVAQEDVVHTAGPLQRANNITDDVTGYYYGDSDPNDVQAFEGLAQHILIWNDTAVTAAEVRAYVALTAPHILTL